MADDEVVLLRDISGNAITSSSVSQVGIGLPENMTNEEIDEFVKNAEANGAIVDDPDDERITYVSADQIPNDHFGILTFGNNNFTTPMNYTVRDYESDGIKYQSCFANDNFNYVACATATISEVNEFNRVQDDIFETLCLSLARNGFPNVTMQRCDNTSNNGNFKSLTCVVYGSGQVKHKEQSVNCDVTVYFNAPKSGNTIYEMAIVEPTDSDYKLNQEDKKKFVEKFTSIDG